MLLVALPLVMPMVRVLPVMLRVMRMVRVLQVMLWLMVLLVMPMVRVLQVMLRLTLRLVMMMIPATEQPPSGWKSARLEGTHPLPATNSRRPDGRVRARRVPSPCRLRTAAVRMDE